MIYPQYPSIALGGDIILCCSIQYSVVWTIPHEKHIIQYELYKSVKFTCIILRSVTEDYAGIYTCSNHTKRAEVILRVYGKYF